MWPHVYLVIKLLSSDTCSLLSTIMGLEDGNVFLYHLDTVTNIKCITIEINFLHPTHIADFHILLLYI
jgi:hypothetical protein